MMVAPPPASEIVAATFPPVNVLPAAATLALPPVCSGSIVVLTMYRIGFGGAGEPMIALIAGLDHPYWLANSPQRNPTHGVNGSGAATADDNCRIVSRTLSAIGPDPLS